MERFKLSYTRSRRQKAIMAIAAILVFITTYALILPAITIDTDTAEREPGMGPEVEIAEQAAHPDMPAVALEAAAEGISIGIDAEEGVFPAGTTMSFSVEESETLQIMMQATLKSEIKRYQAIKFDFRDADGAPVAPMGYYSVKVITDFLEDDAEYSLIQIEGEAVAVTEEAEFTYKQVVFTSNAGTLFAIAEPSEHVSRTLTASGELYEATVTYDYTAHIPKGATLEIVEFDHDSSEYETSVRDFSDARAEAQAGEDAEKDGNEAPEEEPDSLFHDIIDLTIYDKDGSVVEPYSTVQVSIRRLDVPEDLSTTDGGLIVEHLNETGKTPVLETMDSAVMLVDDTMTASFEAESFSRYSLRWNSGGKSVTVYYGFINNNGQFQEFATGTPAHAPDFANSNNYVGNNLHYSYLIQDIPGYKYKETRRNGYTGTLISPLLAYNSSNWRYTTNTSTDHHPYNESSNGTVWTNLSSGNSIYVIYEPDDSEPTEGGVPTVYETATSLPDPPTMHKTSENNHDGTRTITLSVDGRANPILVEKLADVIIVFDRSGSMKNTIEGNTPTGNEKSRLESGVEAIGKLADNLLGPDFRNKDDRPQVRMALVTFSNVAEYNLLSESDPIILEDGEAWQPHPDLHFTTSATKFKSLLSGVSADGGTNWEMALKLANEIPVDPERKTIVIFITDGDPTFRVTRDPSGAVTDLRMQDDCDENYYRHYNVFGHGSDDPYLYNFDAALTQATGIVDQNKEFYCIGISNDVDVDKVDRLTTGAGAGENHSVVVNHWADLEGAFEDIKVNITGHLGYSDVHMTDGITTMTNLVAKSPLVGASNEITYRKVYKLANGQIDEDRTIDDWDPTSEGCNEAQYNPETACMEWDMGADFQLEDGVTYEVSFKVWPDQHAIDLVTQLNNGQITLDDLTAEEASQFEVVSQGGYEIYTLKTNTDAALTYTPTRYNNTGSSEALGPSVTTPCLDQVEPLVMQTMKLKVSKDFQDSFGDETGDGVGADRPTQVELYLQVRPVGGSDSDWTDLNIVPQGDGTVSNRILLNAVKGWTSPEFYVSPGLIDKDGVTREDGYEFRVLEPVLDYHYQLEGEVINPVLEGHEDDNVPGLLYEESLRSTREVYFVKVFNGDYDESLDLTAANVVKGGININKVVLNAGGAEVTPDNVTFHFEGWILDPDGNPYLFDPANDDRVDKTVKNDPNAPLFMQHQNDPIPYHTYGQDGKRVIYKGHYADTSDISFDLKAGESIRFPIIPTGSTFRFWEVDGSGMPTGYVLDSAVGILQENKKDPVTETYSFALADELDHYPTTDSQNRISGEIYGNRLDVLKFTNRQVESGKLVVRKAVVKSDLTTEIYPEDDVFTFAGFIRERYTVWGYTRYRGYSLDYVIRNRDGSQASSGHISNTNNNLTFSLKAGQYIEFLDVPTGAQYQFQENINTMSSDYEFVDAEAHAFSSNGSTATQPSVSAAGTVSGTMAANTEHDSVFRNKIAQNPVPLQIIKVYARDTSERINDASFMLYTDSAHNTPATDYQGNPIGVITTGGYRDEEETQPLGFARIGDLWPGTYYLVETVTPADYRPPSNHWIITIGNDGSVTLTDPDNASATGTGNVTENNGIITVAIPNSKYSDSVLPHTGGIGTTLIYISGGLLITAAAWIYIFRFRQRKGGKRRPEFP